MPENVVLMNPDDGPSPWLRATTIRSDEPAPFYGNPAPEGSIPLIPDAAGVPIAAPAHGIFIPAPGGELFAAALKSGKVLYGPGLSWTVKDGRIVLKRTPPPNF